MLSFNDHGAGSIVVTLVLAGQQRRGGAGGAGCTVVGQGRALTCQRALYALHVHDKGWSRLIGIISIFILTIVINIGVST